MLDAAWLIPAFPLTGFLLLVLLGRKLGEPLAGWIATVAMAGSFVSTVIVFFGLTDRPGDDRAPAHARTNAATSPADLISMVRKSRRGVPPCARRAASAYAAHHGWRRTGAGRTSLAC